MSEHLTADYSELLAKYQEPLEKGVKMPYTLWGRVCRVNGVRAPDLAELRLIGSHIHSEKAVQYSGWGWKLLKYYLPEPKQGELDPFMELRGLLRALLSSGGNAELERQLAEEKAKNQVLEKKVKEKA